MFHAGVDVIRPIGAAFYGPCSGYGGCTGDCECAGMPQVSTLILGEVVCNRSCGSRPANIKLYHTSTDSIICEYNTTVDENGEFNVV